MDGLRARGYCAQIVRVCATAGCLHLCGRVTKNQTRVIYKAEPKSAKGSFPSNYNHHDLPLLEHRECTPTNAHNVNNSFDILAPP